MRRTLLTVAMAVAASMIGSGTAAAAQSAPSPSAHMQMTGAPMGTEHHHSGSGMDGMSPGMDMHHHDGAVDPAHIANLAAPGLVFVRQIVHLQVALIDRQGQLEHATTTWDSAQGTGFFLNDTGWLVTAASVARDVRKEARRYGINYAFHNFIDRNVPVDGARHHTSAGNDSELQTCYDDPNSNYCAVFSYVTYRVYPYLSPPAPASGFAAELDRLDLTGGRSVAVLRIGGSWPAESLHQGADASLPDHALAIGFAQPPTSASIGPLSTVVALTSTPKPGIADEADHHRLHHLLGEGATGGFSGAPLLDLTTGDVVGMLDEGNPVITAKAIVAAINTAGTVAETGQIDQLWANALGHYDYHHYLPAYYALQDVVRNDPQHPLAQRFLDVAAKEKGGPNDQTSDAEVTTLAHKGSSSSLLSSVGFVAGLAALAALLVLGIVGYVTHRRSSGGGARHADRTPAPSPPAHDVGTAAAGVARDQPDEAKGIPDQAQVAPGGATSLRRSPVLPRPHPGSATGRPVAHQPGMRGAALAEARFCVECGTNLPRHARFCALCGEPAAR